MTVQPKCSEKKNYHPSEFVDINGRRIEIDSNLVSLIKALNKAGLKTTECCQGGPHHSSPTIHIRQHIVLDLTNISLKTESNQLTIYWSSKT